MKIPIACSLDQATARAQIDEWRSVLGAMASDVEWVQATTLRVKLRSDAGSVAELLELARREAACCTFFNFALEIDAGSLTFAVSVPPDAVPVLQDFAKLVQS